MPFDYKKEYKEFYLPPTTPGIVTVPAMNFLAVRGQGDPNEEDGAYKQALGMLYAVAFTIKMSKMGKHKLEGYFDYVVPHLEGLWWQEGVHGVDYACKADFQWISLIRLPEFVTREVFDWASPPRWPPWRNTPRPRAMRRTLGRVGSTTRSTSVMCGGVNRSG